MDFDEAMAEAVATRRSRAPRGLGSSPALVVVDFQRAYTKGPRHGRSMADALVSTSELIEFARSSEVPVLYVTTVHNSVESLPRGWRPEYVGEIAFLTLRGTAGSEIHPTVAARPGDVILEKVHASGFLGTNLEDRLRALGVDTLLLAGTATSGCIRATAIDAAARSYFAQVVEECVDDPRMISGIVALNDMAERYGDVVSLRSTLEYLAEFAAA